MPQRERNFVPNSACAKASAADAAAGTLVPLVNLRKGFVGRCRQGTFISWSTCARLLQPMSPPGTLLSIQLAQRHILPMSLREPWFPSQHAQRLLSPSHSRNAWAGETTQSIFKIVCHHKRMLEKLSRKGLCTHHKRMFVLTTRAGSRHLEIEKLVCLPVQSTVKCVGTGLTVQ